MTDLTIQCAWCRRVKQDGVWKFVEKIEALITHTICLECTIKYWGDLKPEVINTNV